MKLDLLPDNLTRWFAAAQREATTQALIHVDCNIRKCRRDGCCSGPLLVIDANGNRQLAPPEPFTVAEDGDITPICHAYLTERSLREIDERLSHLIGEPESDAATITERTRTLAARTWRSIYPGYLR